MFTVFVPAWCREGGQHDTTLTYEEIRRYERQAVTRRAFGGESDIIVYPPGDPLPWEFP